MEIIKDSKDIFMGKIVPHKDGGSVAFKCSQCDSVVPGQMVGEELQFSCSCFPGTVFSCWPSVIDELK